MFSEHATTRQEERDAAKKKKCEEAAVEMAEQRRASATKKAEAKRIDRSTFLHAVVEAVHESRGVVFISETSYICAHASAGRLVTHPVHCPFAWAIDHASAR